MTSDNRNGENTKSPDASAPQNSPAGQKQGGGGRGRKPRSGGSGRTVAAKSKQKDGGNQQPSPVAASRQDSPAKPKQSAVPAAQKDPSPKSGAKSKGRGRKPKPTQPKTLKVIPLGGLDGIGKNMTAFEYGEDMIVIDAGLMFPDDDHPGVDLILPDYSYVIENAHKLRGIFVTHGHEDHTGALPYLLKDLGGQQQIIATKLTLGLIRGKFEEHKVKNVKLVEQKAGESVTKGAFSVEFFNVNHSIPDGVGMMIRTPVGNVLHTGDFKLDQTPIDGRVTDYAAITRFGEEGVMLLLSDSTNAVSSGYTKSESEVGLALSAIISQAKGRVIVASFSSHIHRLQQIADAAIRSGRRVVVTGRSMLRNTAIARELGYLSVDDDYILDAYDIRDYAPEDIVVLCTGSQGEPLSALSRMAAGEHRTISITERDTIILSATPVPGNEKAVTNVVNRLTKIGADVFDKRRAGVHVSGHAAAEELKLILNMVKPEYFLPVHGEAMHLIAHRKLAEQVGIPPEYIFVLENGDVLEFDKEGAAVTGCVPSGVIYVDGLNVGDMDSVVLRDRQHMAKDGIVTVVFTVNKRQMRLVGNAEIIVRGVSAANEEAFMADMTARATKTLEKAVKERAELSVCRRAVRDSVSQMIWERLKRRPMVIPVILEV